MTSINFERRQILCCGLEALPESLDCNSILLITAGLDDLPEIVLSARECRRAETMETVSSRRFLAARRVLRGMFSKLLGIAPDSITVEVDDNGKPFIPGTDHHFSIAHSEERVAVAFSRLPVGVDLEGERPVDISSLARRFFSREEAEFLRMHPEPAHFFRLWTCREAAVKADGRGLGKLLGQTRISMEMDSVKETTDVMIGDMLWMARHFIDPDQMHLALSFQQPPSLISWCDLRGEVIL
jgi:4'-phosphopantetheinyl transferase